MDSLVIRIAPVLVLAAAAAAQQPPALRFAHVFGDHAVLQRDRPLHLWGRAAPGLRVHVAVGAAAAVEATTGDDGVWVARLAPLPASAQPVEVTASAGDQRAVLRDVLIGEVWLCSGQSNMQWGVQADTEWGMEKECADFPAVRYCSMGRWSAQPLDDLPAPLTWRAATRDNPELGRFSAVSYHFAVRLHRYLKVPVGIVHNAVGGTLAESWTSRAALEELPALRGFLDHFDRRVRDWPEERARREREHEAARAAAAACGAEPPRPPDLRGPLDDRNQPAGCYNGMIAPIGNLTLRGALFLQGENNSIGRWNAYRHCFPAMIADWRRALGEPELPFGIVSLQAFGPHGLELEPEMVTVPPGTFWYAAIRDTHFHTYRSTPHTGLVTTCDLGDTANIHPALKRGVGQRAARWALASVYGQPVLHRAPEYRGFEVHGDRIELSFDVDPAVQQVVKRQPGELVWWLDWPISRVGADYRGFVIAGADRVFRPARARRAKRPGHLEVWSEHVPEPVAVRYGWSGYPEGNAIGHDFLPVHPFRTDDWPLVPDAPLESAERTAWNEQLEELRRRARRASEQRELRHARDLVARLGRERGRGLPEEARADLAKAAADAEQALQRLGALLPDR